MRDFLVFSPHVIILTLETCNNELKKGKYKWLYHYYNKCVCIYYFMDLENAEHIYKTRH